MQMQKGVTHSIASGLRGSPAAVLALVGIFAVVPRAIILRRLVRRTWGDVTKRTRQGVALRRSTAAVTGLALAWLIAPTSAHAVNAYITSAGGNTVSVTATATNTVIATIPVGHFPFGVAVTPDGCKVYVANDNDATVSVQASR
jgi:YVTN family beta-propeller protein